MASSLFRLSCFFTKCLLPLKKKRGPTLARHHLQALYIYICIYERARQSPRELHCVPMSRDDAEIPDQISDGLFLSNLASRHGEDILRMFNITTICDLATLPPFLSKPPKFSGMAVHEFSVLDDEDADIIPAAKQVLAIIAAQR